MFLSALSLFVFWISPETGDKIGYSVTVFLSFNVFMVLGAEIMPTTSKNTPIFEMYLFLSLLYCTLYILLSMIVLHMYYQDTSRPIPRWLAKCLFPSLNRQEAQPLPMYQEPGNNQTTQNRPLQTQNIKSLEVTKASGTNSDPSVKELLKNILKVQKGMLFELKGGKRTKVQQQLSLSWQQAAIRLDRLLFWIFACVVFLTNLTALNGILL